MTTEVPKECFQTTYGIPNRIATGAAATFWFRTLMVAASHNQRNFAPRHRSH